MNLYGLLATFVNLLFTILTYAIIARSLISWFPIRQDNKLVVLLNEITEPVLDPLRRIIPKLGTIDITPIVAIVLLQVLETLILTVIRSAT